VGSLQKTPKKQQFSWSSQRRKNRSCACESHGSDATKPQRTEQAKPFQTRGRRVPALTSFLRPTDLTNHLELKQFMKKTILFVLTISAAALVSASAADVKENWDKICAKCHGPEGKGDTKMGQKLGIKDLTDAKVQAEFKDEQAVKAVKEGIKDADGKIKMKPVEGLSDADINGLVAHVRTLKK
jgi:cytochrome c553